MLRVVHPALSFQFVVQHDVGIIQCLQDLLHVPCRLQARIVFEERRATPDHSLQIDILPMICPRHPEVADHMVLSLSHGHGGFHSEGATECRDRNPTEECGVLWFEMCFGGAGVPGIVV